MRAELCGENTLRPPGDHRPRAARSVLGVVRSGHASLLKGVAPRADALPMLGNVLGATGDMPARAEALRECAVVARRASLRSPLAHALCGLSALARDRNDLDAATALLERRDVLGVTVGHDHTNSSEGRLYGIPSATAAPSAGRRTAQGRH